MNLLKYKEGRYKTMKTNNKNTFEVRQVDGIMFDEGWIWNTSYLVGYFSTSAKNEKRAFIRFLNNKGIYFKKNRTIIDVQDGGYILEVQDRKTKEPLFAAIYKEQ